MLAHTLSGAREQVVDELEHHADACNGSGLPSVERHHRIEAILEDLVKALRFGGVDEPLLTESTVDPAIEREERELLRRYVKKANEGV